MTSLLKYLLMISLSIYITGCSALRQTPDLEYITPKRNVSLNLGESVIVHGAMESCAREARTWADISHLVPHSETGFFSNGGYTLIKTDKCREPAPALGVKFTANKIGTEDLIVLGDPLTIVVGNHVNFLQSGVPNPKKTEAPKSALDTLIEWIER